MSSLASARQRLFNLRAFIGRLTPRVGRTGAVAIVTALCAPMLVMIVGFVIDFGYASYINQCLSRAADDATLGSVSQTAATAGGGYGDLAYLQATGVKYFNANTAKLAVTGVNFSLSVVSDGNNGVIATGSYTYNVPTFFASFIGFNTIPVSGSAKTTAHPLVYVNYYIIVDASQSMGIASTPSDMTRLYNAVAASANGPTGCVFGCHVLQSGQSVTNEAIAHNASPPIQLRIDAAVQAVQSIISLAQGVAATTKNIKFALYTIQDDPALILPLQASQTVQTVYPMSNDYAALLTAAATIKLGNNNANGRGDTDYTTELSAFNTALTAAGVTLNGSGASATSPLNYFFIITDGVRDTYGGCNGAYKHCIGAMTGCNPLKTKGTVGVIYTTYDKIWANNNPSAGILETSYSDLVNGMSSTIKPALQSCATSANYFFEANYAPDIVAAMQTLFLSTQPSSARITQ